ncbi:hypothetical protein [Microbacterium oleivorans]|uniref:Uncharacterized protein n=1 Tax=Microbacterium oleivorans TaxID=273677 RepID=A0A4R5YHI7_9MICO|nr:hypothetical protein [Microbacterium oleivorans]TDL43858.1 hypothetical protein E2R54_11755 [Microbacterium oleivorans]
MTAGACEYGCCSAEVAALKDGGWVSTEKGYVLDPRRRKHVDRVIAEAMARADRMQADLPRCRLCGHRALRLDAFGLCSKISESHKAARGGITFQPAGRRR